MDLSNVLKKLIAGSHAAEGFKAAIRDYETGVESHRILVKERSPHIKVLRTLIQMLESFPEEPIESVEVEGHSDCSSYTGRLIMYPSRREVRFDWNCTWKAEQMGYVDFLGFPDQSRAAREFEHQCFRQFTEVTEELAG